MSRCSICISSGSGPSPAFGFAPPKSWGNFFSQASILSNLTTSQQIYPGQPGAHGLFVRAPALIARQQPRAGTERGQLRFDAPEAPAAVRAEGREQLALQRQGARARRRPAGPSARTSWASRPARRQSRRRPAAAPRARWPRRRTARPSRAPRWRGSRRCRARRAARAELPARQPGDELREGLRGPGAGIIDDNGLHMFLLPAAAGQLYSIPGPPGRQMLIFHAFPCPASIGRIR